MASIPFHHYHGTRGSLKDCPACSCRAQLPERTWLWNTYPLHLLTLKLCLFQQDNARPHSSWVTTAWLHSHWVWVLDWPACSPDPYPIGNLWRIMKRRIRQRRPRTVQQLKSCIHQEWAKIPLAKLQKIISSVLKWLQSEWIERKGDVP